MIPARHSYGLLLLEHGRAAEAEAIYREDFKQYMNNVWPLLGLHQALKQQEKTEEAELVYALFKEKRIRGDVKIGASCLCAKKIVSQSHTMA